MKIKIALVVVAILLVGIAIPKLTVWDAVQLTGEERSCVQASVRQQFDHPLQRTALALGKTVVVEKIARAANVKPNTMIVESYTIFRIPLPATRLFNQFTQEVICDRASEKVSVSADATPTLDIDIMLPVPIIGWYQHRINDSSIILTRQEKLPYIGATEFTAYGEQIGIHLEKIEISPQKWAISYVGDDVLVQSKKWSTFYGQTLLVTEGEAGGSSGKQYTQYLFVDGMVYIVSLYPLEIYDASGKATRNTLALYDARGVLHRLLPHILAQESVQRQMAENCAQDVPREKIDDTFVDTENKIVQFGWWDNETKDNISLIVPYHPETDFAGCSESVKSILKNIQPIPRN